MNPWSCGFGVQHNGLTALGFKAGLGYIGDYIRQFFEIELRREETRVSLAQADPALSMITVIDFPRASAVPQELEIGTRASLQRAEQITAWTTGDRLTEHHPEIIAEALHGDCELALVGWANGASAARDAARYRRGS